MEADIGEFDAPEPTHREIGEAKFSIYRTVDFIEYYLLAFLRGDKGRYK